MRKQHEKGQSLVEFVFVLPIALCALCCILELGWISYRTGAVIYSLRRATWHLDLSREARNVMRTHQHYSNLDLSQRFLDTLEMQNTEIFNLVKIQNINIDYLNVNVFPGTKKFLYNRNRKVYRAKDYFEDQYITSGAEISGHLTYAIDTITPIGKLIIGPKYEFQTNIYRVRKLYLKGGSQFDG